MQQAHGETVRAKDETIAALREQLDSLRQSQQALLSAQATDTDKRRDEPGQTPTVAPQTVPGVQEAPAAAQAGTPGAWGRLRAGWGWARSIMNKNGAVALVVLVVAVPIGILWLFLAANDSGQ